MKTAASHGFKDAESKILAIKEIKRRSTRSAIFYYKEGVKELQSNNHKKAEQYFRMAIKLRPNFIEAYNNLGVVLSMQGRYEESITLLKNALSVFPKEADLHANIGYTYSKIHKWEKAIEHYRKSLSIDPKNERNRYNLNEALVQIGK